MKPLAEIVVDAGLLSKDEATRVGKLTDGTSSSLLRAFLESGITETRLYAAMQSQLQLPLLDSAVVVDSDALREVPSDVAKRLAALPYEIVFDNAQKVLKVAIADPTDLVATMELAEVARCELEFALMPLSVVMPLIAKHYRGYSTAVVNRRGSTQGQNSRASSTGQHGTQGTIDSMQRKRKRSAGFAVEEEVSVTAQVPLSELRAGGYDLAAPASNWRDLELRFNALVRVLHEKNLVSDADLLAAIAAVARETAE